MPIVTCGRYSRLGRQLADGILFMARWRTACSNFGGLPPCSLINTDGVSTLLPPTLAVALFTSLDLTHLHQILTDETSFASKELLHERLFLLLAVVN